MMKKRRKVLSILMTIVMSVSIGAMCAVSGTADVACADTSAKNINFGTDVISAPDITDSENPTWDEVYFGVFKSNPVAWRVLDTKGNATGASDSLSDGTNAVANSDAIFLCTEELPYVTISFNASDSDNNQYQGSDIQKWCKKFSGETASTSLTAFSSAELGAVLQTNKSDERFYIADVEGAPYQYSFEAPATSDILNGDRVFMLSAEEAFTTNYGFTNNAARTAKVNGQTGQYNWWWLRSPQGNQYLAGRIYATGYIGNGFIDTTWFTRPAFNLNKNKVLFTSSADASAETALTSVTNQTGSEWKLTLATEDSFDSGANIDKTTVKQGGTFTLTHKELTAFSGGTYDTITAMLTNDSGDIIAYGSGTTDSSGTSTVFTLPADIAEGSYTLSLYAEDWNGEKLTNYATGTPYTVTLTVGDEEEPVEPTPDNPSPSGQTDENQKETKQVEKTPVTNAETGDETNLALYIMIAGMGLCAALGVATQKRKIAALSGSKKHS